MSQKIPLSVVVLIQNEEDCIVPCLQSVQWASELIVIDSGSTDNTVVKAEQIGAKVIRHALINFAEQRNFALSQVSQNWVFMIDADEVITPALAAEIQQAITQSHYQGFKIPRQDFAFGKWLKYGETGLIYLLRLAQKNAGVWVNPVHELWQVNGLVGKLHNPLLHYSHPDISEFLEKVNRYTTADAQALYEQGIRTPFWLLPLYPFAKFIVNYIVKFGFMDGVHGFLFACLMSLYSFTKRAKLWLLWYEHDRKGKR